ncbi:MAG: hypothetical protein AAF708_10835 [Deinococcota bacterium]
MQRRFNAIFCSLLVWFFVSACSGQSHQLSDQPIQSAPPVELDSTYYLPQRDSVATMTETLVLEDALRGKNLLTTVVYPTTAASFPVIVSSHGFLGSGSAPRALAEYWAAYGYVVIMPTHADSRDFGPPPTDTRPASPAAWDNRSQDIALLLNSLDVLEHALTHFTGAFDSSAIAVAGHSFGAYTTLLVAGATVTTPDGQTRSFDDPRPRAFLTLSPPGLGEWTGLDETSWDSLNHPIMFATGSLDFVAGRGPAWSQEGYLFSPEGDEYALFIEGADHEDFSGREPKEGAPAEVIYASLRSASLAFFDAYVQDVNAARDYLQSDQLERGSSGIAVINSK